MLIELDKHCAFTSKVLADFCNQLGKDEGICIEGSTIASIKPTVELSHFMTEFERTIEYAWFTIATQQHTLTLKDDEIRIERLGSGRGRITISRSLIERWIQSIRTLAQQLSISPLTIHKRRTLVAQVLARLLFDVQLRGAQPQGFPNFIALLGPHPSSDPAYTAASSRIWISSADFAHYRRRVSEGGPQSLEYADHDASHFGWSTEFSRGHRMWTRNPSIVPPHLDADWRKTTLVSFMCYPEFFNLDRLSIVYTLEKSLPTAWALPDLASPPFAILPRDHNEMLYSLAEDPIYPSISPFLGGSMFPYMRSQYQEMQYYCSEEQIQFTHLVHISVGVEGPMARPVTSHPSGGGSAVPNYRNYLGVFVTMMISHLDEEQPHLAPIDVRIGRLREVLYRSMADELQEEMDSALKSLEQSRRVLMLSYEPVRDIAQRILEAQSEAVRIRRVLFDPCHGIFQYGLTGGHYFEPGGKPIAINKHITINSIHERTAEYSQATDAEVEHLKIIVHCSVLGIFGLSHPKTLKRAPSVKEFLEISGRMIRSIDDNLDKIEWGAIDRGLIVKAYKRFFGIDTLSFDGRDSVDAYLKVFGSLKRCLHTQYKGFHEKDRVSTPIGVIAVENDAELSVDGKPIVTDEALTGAAPFLFPATGDHFPVPNMQFVSSLVADIVHFARTSKGAKLQGVSFSSDRNQLSLSFGGTVFSKQGDKTLVELIRENVIGGNAHLQARRAPRRAAFQGNCLGPLQNFADACDDFDPPEQSADSEERNVVVWRISKPGLYNFSLIFKGRSLELKADPLT